MDSAHKNTEAAEWIVLAAWSVKEAPLDRVSVCVCVRDLRLSTVEAVTGFDRGAYDCYTCTCLLFTFHHFSYIKKSQFVWFTHTCLKRHTYLTQTHTQTDVSPPYRKGSKQIIQANHLSGSRDQPKSPQLITFSELTVIYHKHTHTYAQTCAHLHAHTLSFVGTVFAHSLLEQSPSAHHSYLLRAPDFFLLLLFLSFLFLAERALCFALSFYFHTRLLFFFLTVVFLWGVRAVFAYKVLEQMK